MKFHITYPLLAILGLLSSCTSQPVTLAMIGPRPLAGSAPSVGAGWLQVFSETDEYTDDDEYYFPHRDYLIYTTTGKRLRQVWNHHDRFDETPTIVPLPAGQYVVKADADFYGRVTIPVEIRANQTTRVVLQPGWKPTGAFSSSDLVQLPNGYWAGWRAELPKEKLESLR